MSSEYIQVLHTISKNYSRSFNLKKAESYYLESLELATKLYVGKDEAKLIDIWMNLADIYIRLSNFDAAETYYSKVQTTLEKNLEVNYSTYTNLLVNMGDMFYQKNNHKKAEKYYYNALKIQEEYSPKDSLKYVNIAYKLAEALFVLSKYEKAEWYYRKIIELREKIFGTEYATIGISPLQRIAEIKDKQAKYTERDESLRKLFKQGYENFVNKRTWVNLGSLDVLFWMDRDFIGPITLGTLSNNQSFSDYLYDYALITKGSSYYDISSIFENLKSAHNDSLMIKKITNYKEKLKKIEQLASTPKIQRQYSYNDLLTEIQKEEIDLRKESAFFDKCVRKYTVTWDELKNQLSLREAAIEFIQLKNRYSALILKSNESKPIWVDLCSVQQLDSLMIRKSINDYQEINRIYNDIRLYGLLWQPLEKYLSNIDHVFFSTTKNLNEIAFRAIKVPNGKFLDSYIKLTQLSGTYELLEKSQKISINNNNELALFGGIDYDAEATYLIQDKKNQFFNDSTINFTTLRDSRVNKFGKLPFTLIEVDSIKKIMGETGTLLTGAVASENQFKMLSRTRNKSPKIIHIATHGFYFPKPANANFDFKSITFNKNFTPDSSKRLKITDIESGIALSGVNLSLQRLGPKNQLEDGILTPREVEKLNLINTELVVLSACETAKSYQSILGNASGFQKAFKKAGVKNILLSLWKVDDFSTQKMMKIFYKSLKSGSTVEEGYHDMVNEMKVLYPNDPYRWASFVLLR